MTTNTYTPAERSAMQRTINALNAHERKHGEFDSYVDTEQVAADLVHDSGLLAHLEGDVFWEIVQEIASAHYAGVPSITLWLLRPES